MQKKKVSKKELHQSKKKKASEAAALKAKIHNMKFLLRICGLANIYNLYGKITNILQTTNLLPHERLEKFQSTVEDMVKMSQATNHEACPNCPSPSKCYWPYYLPNHAASASLTESIQSSQIHFVLVVDENSSWALVGANQTRQQVTPEEQNKKTDTKKLVESQLKDLSKDLSARLQEDVFTEDEREAIALCARLCNMNDLLRASKAEGAVKAAACHGMQYLSAIRNLPVLSLEHVPDDCLEK